MSTTAIVAMAYAGRAAGPRAKPGATTVPTAMPSVDLADAKPLAELTPGDLQANLTDKLSPPQTKGRAIYFGEVDEYDGPEEDAKLTSSLPILALKDGASWRGGAGGGPGAGEHRLAVRRRGAGEARGVGRARRGRR